MRLRFATFLSALFGALLLAAPAHAIGSLFVVRGVQVEATGESGVKACEAAYSQGNAEAWKKLIQRIVPQSDWGRVADPGPEGLAAFISGYEVSGERRSGTKCIANMTYLFKGELVKKYLREAGIAYADRRGPASLALALYDTPEGTRLWGDDNLWLNAFRVVKLENELIPVDAPYGDDGDKAAIPPGTAMGTDWLTYKTIADKYGMKAVLVAHASYANGQVDVHATLVSEYDSRDFTATGKGDDERGALADAVRQLAFAMGESWKASAAIDNSISAAISVWAPYNSLAERRSIEERLRKIQNILAVSVTRVTTTGMSVYLRYRGRNDQFEKALAEAGFGIYGSGGGLVLTAYKPGEPMSLGQATATPEEPTDPADPTQPTEPEPQPEPEEPQVIKPQ